MSRKRKLVHQPLHEHYYSKKVLNSCMNFRRSRMKRRHEVLKHFIDAPQTTFRIIYIPPTIRKCNIAQILYIF